jgi:phosphohistidine swiveling domain-containing protein
MNRETKWIKYIRGPIYLQRVLPCLKGDFELYPKFFRVPLTRQVYYGNEKVLEWYLEKKWAFQLGRVLIDDFTSNNKYAKKFRKEWNKFYNRAKSVSGRIIWKMDMKRLKDNQLKKFYLDWFSASEHFNAYSNATIDAVDEVLQEDIRAELKKIVKDKILFEEAWRIITTPTEPTYIQKRDLGALEIARRMKSAGGKKINWKKYEKEISSLVKRYWWTTLGWMADKKYLKPEARKEITRFLRDNKLDEKYWQFKNFSKVTEEAKKKELAKINATERLRKILKVFEEVAIFKDQRKEGQVHLVAANKKLIEEIARRKKELKYRDLVWLTDTELVKYLEGKRSLKKVSDARKEHTIVVVLKNNIIIKEGADARELRNKIFPKENKKAVRAFGGLPASRGYTKGKVFISLSPDHANKNVKKGEILVTPQTTPDFVPAMRRAGAVITDEGGATSHAAIISRELNIPCIVGAKIATQVLKTGDKIEVDATKGVVKIIK